MIQSQVLIGALGTPVSLKEYNCLRVKVPI